MAPSQGPPHPSLPVCPTLRLEMAQMQFMRETFQKLNLR